VIFYFGIETRHKSIAEIEDMLGSPDSRLKKAAAGQ
jgi:hypothetical protein